MARGLRQNCIGKTLIDNKGRYLKGQVCLKKMNHLLLLVSQDYTDKEPHHLKLLSLDANLIELEDNAFRGIA